MSSINICLITDNNFALPTAVTIESIAKNSDKNCVYNIYIICNKNVDDANQKKLLACGENRPNIHIELVIVEDDSRYQLFAKKDFPVSISATFKFSIPDLLPELEKVLYIDGDLIVQSDLNAFYSTDVSDVYAGVIKDYHALTFKGDVWERLGIRLEGYFNSGVMLLNLAKMREEEVTEKLIDYRMNGINYYMDQDTLNVVFGHKVKYLDFRYNATLTNWRNKASEDLSVYYKMDYREDKYDYLREAEIVHYCSSDKPWRYYDTHFADVWYKYFLTCPYAHVDLDRKSLHTIIPQKQIKKVRIQEGSVFARNGALKCSTNSAAPLISVILPAYNAEDYIGEAIESVCQSSFANFELICVDDGSQDGTWEIIERYAQADSRVIAVNQKNSYAGVARNNALALARGEYVTFLDSDDLLSACALEKMYTAAISTPADVVVSAAGEFEGTPSKVRPMKYWLKEEYLPKTDKFAPKEILPFIFNFTVGGPGGKLVKMDLVKKHDLKFLELRKSEDFYFVHRAFYKAESIAVIREALYYRRNVPTSLEHTLEKSPLVFYEAIERFKNVLVEDGCYEIYKQSFINENMARFAYNLRSLRKDKNAYDAVLDLFKRIAKEELGLGYYPANYYFHRPNYDYLMQLLQEPEVEEEKVQAPVAGAAGNAASSKPVQKKIAVARKKRSFKSLIHGGIMCCRENGIGYTLKYGCKRVAYWILRKLNGGINCCLENGIIYTIKYAFRKLFGKT